MTTKNEQTATVLAHRTAQGNTQHTEDTKIGRILAELRGGRGLNRFEAERIGDHCLPSTIAVLRAEGISIVSEWEEVPTRFEGKTARVKRYRYAWGA